MDDRLVGFLCDSLDLEKKKIGNLVSGLHALAVEFDRKARVYQDRSLQHNQPYVTGVAIGELIQAMQYTECAKELRGVLSRHGV